MEEKKLPDVVIILDRMVERLGKLREKMLVAPEHFEITYSILRGLEYDKEMGFVVRKNPEPTKIEVHEIINIPETAPVG